MPPNPQRQVGEVLPVVHHRLRSHLRSWSYRYLLAIAPICSFIINIFWLILHLLRLKSINIWQIISHFVLNKWDSLVHLNFARFAGWGSNGLPGSIYRFIFILLAFWMRPAFERGNPDHGSQQVMLNFILSFPYLVIWVFGAILLSFSYAFISYRKSRKFFNWKTRNFIFH